MRLGSIVAQFVDGALVHGHISEMALVPAAAWPIDMDVADDGRRMVVGTWVQGGILCISFQYFMLGTWFSSDSQPTLIYFVLVEHTDHSAMFND